MTLTREQIKKHGDVVEVVAQTIWERDSHPTHYDLIPKSVKRVLVIEAINLIEALTAANLTIAPEWQGIDNNSTNGDVWLVTDGSNMAFAFWKEGKEHESHGSVGGGWCNPASNSFCSASFDWLPTHCKDITPPESEV